MTNTVLIPDFLGLARLRVADTIVRFSCCNEIWIDLGLRVRVTIWNRKMICPCTCLVTPRWTSYGNTIKITQSRCDSEFETICACGILYFSTLWTNYCSTGFEDVYCELNRAARTRGFVSVFNLLFFLNRDNLRTWMTLRNKKRPQSLGNSEHCRQQN